MKRLLVGGAVLALGITGTGLAQAEGGFKVTGGGQALATSDGSSVRGPGDTYGFNAQEVEGDRDDAAKGQFNTIQRVAGETPGRGQGDHVRGEVNCLIPLSGGEDGAARFGGVVRGTENDEDPTLFAVDVTDNGEGSRAEDDDMIVFRTFNESDLEDDETACDQDPDEMPEETILARGNVQIHNAE